MKQKQETEIYHRGKQQTDAHSAIYYILRTIKG